MDPIENFTCPKEVFNIFNKSILYSRFKSKKKKLRDYFIPYSHVKKNTYTFVTSACLTPIRPLVLYNRNVIPADVELTLLADSFTPGTMRLDTFILTPERERIPPMSHKRFTILFHPTFTEVILSYFQLKKE